MDQATEGPEPSTAMPGPMDPFKDRSRTVRFLSNSAHRLKGSLTVMRIYTELIQSGIYGPLGEEASDKVSSIESGIEEMSVFIDEMQDMALLSMLDQSTQPQVFDLEPMIDDLIKGLPPQAQGRMDRPEDAKEDGTISVLARKDLASRALWNLLHFVLDPFEDGERATISCGLDGGRPYLEVLTGREPLGSDEADVLVEAISGDSSALSPGDWKRLTLPLARSFCTSIGSELSISRREGSGFAYRMTFGEPPI